jgi:hypothetical protein
MKHNHAIGVSATTLVLMMAASAGAEPVRPPPLGETGQVATAPAPTPTVPIREARSDQQTPREQPIPKLDESGKKASEPAATGKIEASLLARQIRSRFAALNGCPSEVARLKHVGLGAASAGKLTLRWTILPGGQVSDTAVVVRSPANTFAMDCVKRQMSEWKFAPPEGGAVRLERAFSFRTRSAAAPAAAD